MKLAAALLGAVTISFSSIFFALSETSPVTGAFYRSFYAIPPLLLIWWFRRRQDTRPSKKRWVAVGAGIALGLDVILWHTSIEFIGTGLATLIANSQVIFVAVAAWAFQGERPTRQVMISIPVVLVGVALVSGVGQEGAYGANPVLGTGLALLAAMFYAMFLLGFRRSNDTHAPAAGPLLEATTGALIVSLVVGLAVSGIDFQITWPGHGWLLGLALGSQVAGWLLIGYALPRLPAVETSTIILLQPALTLVWGALVFSERPSALQIFGSIVVLAGVALVVVARARTQPIPAEA